MLEPTTEQLVLPRVALVEGDLLDQNVDAIVNAWNRNVIPWWLLLPQGVSGAIKRRAGLAPFKELSRFGAIKLGEAVMTGPGRLSYKGIIHVAGINLFWRASEYSIRKSIVSAIRLAKQAHMSSIAIPLIGAGSGGISTERSKRIIIDQLSAIELELDVRVVTYKGA